MKNFIYQCTNPKCELRFPVHENSGFNERCPKCLGKTELVHTSEAAQENRNDRKARTGNILVVIDNVRSAFNVGAMLRTAECFGVETIYLCGITPDISDKNVQKASIGSEQYLQVIHKNNSLKTVQELIGLGYEIWSLELDDNAIDLTSVKLGDRKIALIVGNERCGVDPAILALSTQIIQIPMLGNKNSLNVEVSFGIAISTLSTFPRN